MTGLLLGQIVHFHTVVRKIWSNIGISCIYSWYWLLQICVSDNQPFEIFYNYHDNELIFHKQQFTRPFNNHNQQSEVWPHVLCDYLPDVTVAIFSNATIFTTRQRSFWKLMFSVVFVYLFSLDLNPPLRTCSNLFATHYTGHPQSQPWCPSLYRDPSSPSPQPPFPMWLANRVFHKLSTKQESQYCRYCLAVPWEGNWSNEFCNLEM